MTILKANPNIDEATATLLSRWMDLNLNGEPVTPELWISRIMGTDGSTRELVRTETNGVAIRVNGLVLDPWLAWNGGEDTLICDEAFIKWLIEAQTGLTVRLEVPAR